MAAGTNVVAVDDAKELIHETPHTVRVLFSCSGIGILNRGIETFFREAFDGLRGMANVEMLLLKGAGRAEVGEKVLWNLPRTGRLASVLGQLARRNAYVAEQWSTFLPVVWQIRCFRPHVIFYSDANLGFLLYWFRKYIGVPYKLLFSNGGPCHPPFVRTDFVHQVAPLYYNEALAAGEPREKHFLVPYGINVPPKPPRVCADEKKAARAKLGLPVDRPIVLSVGWIARQHKRMDYVVEEIAKLPEPRPFLQLLGAMDEGSRDIIALGNRLLGTGGFSVRSVPYANVGDYYRAADCFVLASLQEGFGRVYLEAQMHGLPVIAHRHPVMEFVLGEHGTLADLTQAGALAREVADSLHRPTTDATARERWSSVGERFGWDSLQSRYREMFVRCAGQAMQ
jgi:1,2-diacylglycerol 3-alpha-glucosyltransferase